MKRHEHPGADFFVRRQLLLYSYLVSAISSGVPVHTSIIVLDYRTHKIYELTVNVATSSCEREDTKVHDSGNRAVYSRIV